MRPSQDISGPDVAIAQPCAHEDTSVAIEAPQVALDLDEVLITDLFGYRVKEGAEPDRCELLARRVAG